MQFEGETRLLTPESVLSTYELALRDPVINTGASANSSPFAWQESFWAGGRLKCPTFDQITSGNYFFHAQPHTPHTFTPWKLPQMPHRQLRALTGCRVTQNKWRRTSCPGMKSWRCDRRYGAQMDPTAAFRALPSNYSSPCTLARAPSSPSKSPFWQFPSLPVPAPTLHGCWRGVLLSNQGRA